MLDRRLAIAAGCVLGLAAGWFARARLYPAVPPAPSRADVFAGIYRDGTWGRNDRDGTSGFGSTVRTTALYRAYLEQLVKDAHVHSVVDAGCGDWEFSKVIDWTGIDYKGYDIVGSLVAQDTQRYGKPNVQFFTADIIDADLPPADLLIVKNVLQHLQNADVQRFLAKQLPKYKLAILTDGVDAHTLSSTNPDIRTGAYRPLDPGQPPFSIAGQKVLTYFDGQAMQQVYLVTR